MAHININGTTEELFDKIMKLENYTKRPELIRYFIKEYWKNKPSTPQTPHS